jgi:arginine/lysine/ornithine decarboxylase
VIYYIMSRTKLEWTPERLAQIKALHDEGQSYTKILQWLYDTYGVLYTAARLSQLFKRMKQQDAV